MKLPHHPVRKPRWAAALAVVALAAGFAVAAAGPAHAATGDPTDPNYLGALTIAPTSGSADNAPPFDSLSTTTGCPETHRVGSRTLAYTVDGSGSAVIAAFGAVRNSSHPSLSAPAITLAGTQAGTASVGSRSTWAAVAIDGAFKVLLTCESTVKSANADLNGSKYFAATLKKSAANAWEVVTSTTPAKTATTTTVVAGAITQTSATLTATVAPTSATGTVEFKNGNTVLGTGTVTNGQASTSVSGLTANTDYTLTANYLGDTTHEASAGTVALKTVAEPTVPPADTADSDISVTVPVEAAAPYKGLTITTAPATSIPLQGVTATRDQGQVWAASGQLGDVTVTDDRPEAERKAWNLTGALSNNQFVQTGGAGTIAASEFSWTPEKVSGDGTQGAAGKITEAKTLASGPVATARDSVTTVKAGLSLNVPTGTPDGNYTAKLTLTLI